MTARRIGGPPRPALETFISGAPRKHTLPWRAPNVRDDLYVQVNVRQPERLALQIEWLAGEMGITKREAIETALREWAARELRKRGVDS